jgi:LacI family transcriptional regulator
MAERNAPNGTDRRTHVAMALVWHDFAHWVGARRYAMRAGWALHQLGVLDVPLVSRGAVGGLICQLHPDARELVAAVRKARIPKVELSDKVPDMAVPRVMPDFAAAGRMAAEHLVERRFRRFAFVGLSQQATGTEGDWLRGFRQPVQRAGGELVVLYAGDFLKTLSSHGSASGRTLPSPGCFDAAPVMAETLAGMPRPLGVFVSDLWFCVELIDACLARGLYVPEEVAFVSAGGESHEAELASVPVSCVVLDFERQAYEAAALLDRMMKGQKVPAECCWVAPRELVVRPSSDVIAVESIQVARALRYIAENLSDKRLAPARAAEAVGVSRRSLYYAFGEHLGRPIAAEIDRLRVARAAELLGDTDMSVAAVADACGYTDRKHLHRSFVRAMGVAPLAYRAGRAAQTAGGRTADDGRRNTSIRGPMQ